MLSSFFKKDKVELIPVIELGYNNQGVTPPQSKNYRYWEDPEIWDDYNRKSYIRAGFKDEFIPYLKGSSFYEPSKISDRDFKKIVIEHIEDMKDKNGTYDRELAYCMFGGFVLKVNGENVYFPQCCGGLADIKYWESLSKSKHFPYSGHPAPSLSFNSKRVVFDFTVGKFDENFEPPTKYINLKINTNQLGLAVEKAKVELRELALRIEKINSEEELNIDRLGDLLIWEDLDHL